MVTKRPIKVKDHLFVLGRYHIHIIDLKQKQTFIMSKHGENKALDEAQKARKIFETLED